MCTLLFLLRLSVWFDPTSLFGSLPSEFCSWLIASLVVVAWLDWTNFGHKGIPSGNLIIVNNCTPATLMQCSKICSKIIFLILISRPRGDVTLCVSLDLIPLKKIFLIFGYFVLLKVEVSEAIKDLSYVENGCIGY